MNINFEELITEKYLDGVIDDDHYLELLEKANLRDKEYQSFKVKKSSELSLDEAKKDLQLREKYDELSNEARKRMAQKFYTLGQHDFTLTPAQYDIAKDYIKYLKRSERFDKGFAALNAAALTYNAYNAGKNINEMKGKHKPDKSRKTNRNSAAIQGAATAFHGKFLADSIKRNRAEKKKMEEGIKRRTQK